MFLAEMDKVVLWDSLLKVIVPFYPVAGRGRRPYPVQTMLRVHLMQNWFGLSDPARVVMVMRISRSVIATPAPVEDDSGRGYGVDPEVRKSGCRLSGKLGCRPTTRRTINGLHDNYTFDKANRLTATSIRENGVPVVSSYL